VCVAVCVAALFFLLRYGVLWHFIASTDPLIKLMLQCVLHHVLQHSCHVCCNVFFPGVLWYFIVSADFRIQQLLQCVLQCVLLCVLLCVLQCVLHCVLHHVLQCLLHCVAMCVAAFLFTLFWCVVAFHRLR